MSQWLVGDIWYVGFTIKHVRYSKSSGHTQRSLAKEFEGVWRADVRSGKYQAEQKQKKHNILFSAAMQDYLDRAAVDQKSYKSTVSRAKHLTAFFGKYPLTSIDQDKVTDYKFHRKAEVDKRAARLQRKENTYATINREQKLLIRVYNWYNKQKRTNIPNPADGIAFYREIKRTRTMEYEEQQRFFTTGEAPQHVKDIVMVALLTGMRKGEILNLKKEEVILDDPKPRIVLRHTKNNKPRTIPLTKELTAFFKRIIDKERPDLKYVFTNPMTGKPMRDIRTSFNKTCKRAGGIENLTFHDLKHTFCTRMSNADVALFDIMKIAGHKDMQTALRYYNPTGEHLMTAMERLEKKSHDYSHDTSDTENKPQQDAVNIKEIHSLNGVGD
jgi:integrase